MALNTDFSAICRTCLSEENLIPILTDMCYESDENFLNKLFTVAGIKMKTNDGLPQNICKNCIKNVNDTIAFRIKCIETEKELLIMKENIEKSVVKDLPESSDCTDNTKLLFKNMTENTDHVITETKIELEKDKEKYLFSDLSNTSDKKSKSKIKEKLKVNTLYEIDETDPLIKRVICMLCQKKLSIRSFWSHISRRHPGADERRVKCELCDDYVLKDKLNRHRILMHGDSFKCRYCKSEFDGREQLLEHVLTCSVKKKRRSCESTRVMSECDICHKSMQKASLRVHKAVKHAGLRPVCEHCGKSFGNKLRLDEHNRSKHGYEKFKCSFCDFESASNVALRNHERRHRGERPFVCETCGAGFHASYLLLQHKHSHRTERKFKCDKCPASFKANNSLHTHRRVCHTQARVSCGLCSRVYSCRHYAVKHMRSVHGCGGPGPSLNIQVSS